MPPQTQVSGRRPRPRLIRGPLVIGEPAPVVEAGLVAQDPYRPDTIADGGAAFGLTVRAASVRGLAKRYTGGPRQDDICLRRHEATGTLIAALADGVSAAPRADIAAALAVRHAAAAVARQLDTGPPPPPIDWAAVFGQAAWALVEEHRRSSGDPQAGIEQAAPLLATTLVVAAVTVTGDDPTRVQVAAVGDSPALVLQARRFEPLVGETADAADLLGAGVDALPLKPHAFASAEHTLDADGVLLLASDGLALPLGDGTGEVGRVLARELRRPPNVIDFARLLDFSRATYDDDRSLIAVWSESA